jgi:hypothetical protein
MRVETPRQNMLSRERTASRACHGQRRHAGRIRRTDDFNLTLTQYGLERSCTGEHPRPLNLPPSSKSIKVQ